MSKAKNNLYPFISIILPTKNNRDIIEDCLKSLINLDYPKSRYEIILVDGHSTDGTPEIASKYGTKVFYDRGRGRASGCNTGVQHACGDYIAFTDADCIVDRHWLTNALKYFTNDTIAGVGGPNIAPAYAPPLIKAIEWVFLQSPSAVKLTTEGSVKSIAGCNSIYVSKLVKKFFPIPEVICGEDTLLNCRIRQAGLNLVSAPDSVVWHNRHYNTLKSFFKQMFLYGRGQVLITRFHKEMGNLLHKVEGFFLPITVLFVVILYFLSKLALGIGIGLGIAFLLYLSAKCFWQTRSLTIAKHVPLVIITEAIGYSMGYIREKFPPESKSK